MNYNEMDVKGMTDNKSKNKVKKKEKKWLTA